MASRPRAILFDWDNTLVDTWPTIVECYETTFRALGRTPWTAAEVQERAHGSLREVFPTLFGERAAEAERVFYETFFRIHLERLEPLAGADTLLAHCHAKGLYVAIVSNKVGDNLRAEVTHLGWDRWIARSVGARDAARDKPAPDPIYLALDGTGIAPDDTVWIDRRQPGGPAMRPRGRLPAGPRRRAGGTAGVVAGSSASAAGA